MRRVLLLLPLLLGAGAGAGAGFYLRDGSDGFSSGAGGPVPEAASGSEVGPEFDYLKLSNQFVVPVVAEGRVKSLVALSLSLELRRGSGDQVFMREPKLRDAFLRVLFDHANAGGFEGDFTAGGNLSALRRSLTSAARQVLGDPVSDVLITDIARQDG